MSSSGVPITVPRSFGGSGGHSSIVRLSLRIGNEEIELAQVSDRQLYFDEAVSLAAGPATVVVEIDGDARATSVVLDGSNGPATIVGYSRVAVS